MGVKYNSELVITAFKTEQRISILCKPKIKYSVCEGNFKQIQKSSKSAFFITFLR